MTPTDAAERLSRPVAELRPHPQAGELPQLTGAELIALKEDVREHDLQVPLEITADGTVLDGHAHLQAAPEIGLSEVPVSIVDPPDPLAYMLLAALLRRQLSASQKAALGVKLVEVGTLRGLRRGTFLLRLDVEGFSEEHVWRLARICDDLPRDRAPAHVRIRPMELRYAKSWSTMKPKQRKRASQR